jgi:hypothetical protein
MRLIFIILIFISPLLYSSDYNRINEVELELFELSLVDSSIVIKWETAFEESNKYFLLERSSNHPKLEFRIIDTLDGAINSKSTKKYTSIDSTVDFGNTYHYRLSTETLDGTVQIHNNIINYVPSVQTSVTESDYNNLINYEFQEGRIVITTPIPIQSQLTLFSLDGKTIDPKVDILNDNYYSVDISGLPRGKYILLYDENLICKFVK